MKTCKGNLCPTKFLSILVLLSVFSQFGNSQLIWKEATFNKNFYSGIAISSADVNGDVVDDLLVLDQSKHLWLGINNGFAHFYWTPLPYHQTSRTWSLNVGDIDRNGYNDILISGQSIQVSILYQDKSGFHLSVVDDTYFLSQAACIFDYNQDGWLDFTLTDDNQATKIYTNTGSGLLLRDTVLIDLNLPDRSKNGGNYGSIWTDFDWDGDPDLYLSKCQPGVDDPKDPRRINLLYVKDAAGWKEQAALYNLNHGDQSWVTVFEDFDNDGLFDAYEINHYTPSKVLKQKTDHTFEDRTITSGLDYGGFAFQVLAFDFDNDADVDVLLTGTSTELWLNDGSMNFQKAELNLSDNPFTSCSAGDFNSDGFLDLYVSYANLLNAPSNQKDKIWINPGNQNHHVTFAFKGVQSNNNGVGVKVKVFTGNKVQVRELHAGESYGIQNSLNLYFGLGDALVIDSLIVYWPSGIVDRHYTLEAGQKYLLNEGSCVHNFSSTIPAKVYSFCNDIDTSFYANPAHHSVIWNDGSVGSKIDVHSEGVYYYTAKDEHNCFLISNPNSIVLNPVVHPQLNINYSRILCEGESLDLSINGYDQVQWSTGELSSELRINKSGAYFGSIHGFCKQEFSDTLIVFSFTRPEPPVVTTDTLYAFEPAVLKGSLDHIKWYESKDADSAVYIGKNFTTDTIRSSRSFWAEAFDLHSYNPVHGGPVIPVYESSPYHADFINNQMLFNVYKDLILDSVTVFTDDPGERQIELFDSKGILLNKTLVFLNKGKSTIFLGYHIPEDSKPYILTTNEAKNIESLGTKSPKLYRSDKDFYYPFFIEDKLRILTSDKGDNYFYYFYDWVIRAEDEMCISERIEVPVVLIPTKTQNDNFNNQGIYLINGNQLIFSEIEGNYFQLEILGLDGRLIQKIENINTSMHFNISPMVPGFYFCKLMVMPQNKARLYRLIVN